MFKHVGGRYLETIFWMMIAEDILLRVWKPDFLQKDYLGLDIAKQVRKIMLVPLEAF